MSANIIVTGLPADATFQKLVYTFRTLFKKIQIKKFWIRDLSETYGMDEKQMTVELSSTADARKARNYLDNFPFVHPSTKEEYLLSAQMDDGSTELVEYPHHWNQGHERSRRASRRDRAHQRSPSPGYRSEASKLDLEIELLRKQRQVIEEERRLLLERKKLDMIREYGPSASRDFVDFDDFEPPRKRRRSPAPMEVKKPRKRSPPPPKPAPKNTNSLPLFFQPCRKLISEMKEFIEQDATTEEKDILLKLIRAALRKNLAIALEGKKYMPTAEIIKLYRELHPTTGDKEFVRKILANIRASYLPDELEGKLAHPKKEAIVAGDKSQPVKMERVENDAKMDAKDENSLEDPSDDNNVGEDSEANRKLSDETESQDKPANANTETDAPKDVNNDVKAELEKSQKTDITFDEISNNTNEELTQGAGVDGKSNNAAGDLPQVENVDEKSNNMVELLPEDKNGVETDKSALSTITEENAELQDAEGGLAVQ